MSSIGPFSCDGWDRSDGLWGTPTREVELQPERKKLLPLDWKRFRAERDQGTGNGTDHPNRWAQRQAPGQEALIRDLLRWCERQTETGTAPFGACAADVPVDATVGSAQSTVNSRRRRLAPTQEDVFMTPTGRRRSTQFSQFWDPRGEGRPAESCLERGNQVGDGVSKVETTDTELKTSFLENSTSRVGERCPPIFGNDGLGIGDTLGVWLESNPTTFECDRTFLPGCSCVFGRFVTWRTGHSSQPYDGGLGNSLRTPAARSNCFKMWKAGSLG